MALHAKIRVKLVLGLSVELALVVSNELDTEPDAVKSHLFGTDGAHLIQAVPDRPNIAYSVLRTPAKEFALRSLLACGTGGAGNTLLQQPDSGLFC